MKSYFRMGCTRMSMDNRTELTGRIALSRRDFLKTSSFAVGLGLMGFGQRLAEAAGHKNRPNILWLTSEDNGISWVSCYGGKNCKTPNIDKLAEVGFQYKHCFACRYRKSN